MKAEELRGYSLHELHTLLREKRKELSDMRYRNAQSPLSDAPSKIPALRKDIARIITVINEKRHERTKSV
ncbi:MAG: 50S ribosomal protein L29 [Bacteroidia bacterium]|nr:50S ribosomal protein L29 [Bacteroidia bacterium]MCX7652707.1 50S ribosomal protein L29 [Bacteroidia bacterium]MDW8416409.1 50S ribosomal protein L29 [Bacteroidia bacterium]